MDFRRLKSRFGLCWTHLENKGSWVAPGWLLGGFWWLLGGSWWLLVAPGWFLGGSWWLLVALGGSWVAPGGSGMLRIRADPFLSGG